MGRRVLGWVLPCEATHNGDNFGVPGWCSGAGTILGSLGGALVLVRHDASRAAIRDSLATHTRSAQLHF